MKNKITVLIVGLIISGSLSLNAENFNLKNFDDTIKVVAKDTFQIDLESNPSTGYRWIYVEKEKEKSAIFVSDVFTAPEDNGMVGVAGRQTFTFKAKKKGITDLTFEYKRSTGDKAKDYKVYIEVLKK